jgi:hypothetical protein
MKTGNVITNAAKCVFPGSLADDVDERSSALTTDISEVKCR